MLKSLSFLYVSCQFVCILPWCVSMLGSKQSQGIVPVCLGLLKHLPMQALHLYIQHSQCFMLTPLAILPTAPDFGAQHTPTRDAV